MERTVSLILMCWIHPRVYGADIMLCLTIISSAGLSPCVRGKLFSKYITNKSSRFIPVCTRQIFMSFLNKFYTRVHPRAYGADSQLLTTEVTNLMMLVIQSPIQTTRVYRSLSGPNVILYRMLPEMPGSYPRFHRYRFYGRLQGTLT